MCSGILRTASPLNSEALSRAVVQSGADAAEPTASVGRALGRAFAAGVAEVGMAGVVDANRMLAPLRKMSPDLEICQ